MEDIESLMGLYECVEDSKNPFITIRIRSLLSRPEMKEITIGNQTRVIKTRISKCGSGNIHEIKMRPIKTYYDIVEKLCEFEEYKYSGFHHLTKGVLYSKILDEPVTETEINLREISAFTPKNSFKSIGNIHAIYLSGLQDTINLYDSCLLNIAKIGEWNGFGKGLTNVSPEEDNRIHNLIFVIYGDMKPYVYNLYCFKKLIDVKTDTILVPHINKKVSIKKLDKIKLVHGLRILRIQDEV